MKTRSEMVWFLIGFGLVALCANTRTMIAEEAASVSATSQSGDPVRSEVSALRAAVESLTGDVYAEPSRWQPLSLSSFFSEGRRTF